MALWWWLAVVGAAATGAAADADKTSAVTEAGCWTGELWQVRTPANADDFDGKPVAMAPCAPEIPAASRCCFRTQRWKPKATAPSAISYGCSDDPECGRDSVSSVNFFDWCTKSDSVVSGNKMAVCLCNDEAGCNDAFDNNDGNDGFIRAVPEPKEGGAAVATVSAAVLLFALAAL